MGCFVDIYLDTACKELTWGFLNLPTGTESSHPSLLTFGASKQAGQFSGMTGRSLLSANWRRDFSRTYTKGRITRRSRSLHGNAILLTKLNSNLFSRFPPSHKTSLNTLLHFSLYYFSLLPAMCLSHDGSLGCLNIHMLLHCLLYQLFILRTTIPCQGSYMWRNISIPTCIIT